MKVLLIQPQSQSNYERFAEACKRNDWSLQIVTAAGTNIKTSAVFPQPLITEQLYLTTDKYSEILDLEDFDCVVPASEFSATIASDLNKLCSKSQESPNKIDLRNKHQVREILATNSIGLSVPFAKIPKEATAENVRKLSKNLKFPVIVKPIDMAGSVLVSCCENEDEVLSAWNKIKAFAKSPLYGFEYACEAIIESFVQGEEYSAEVVLHNGLAAYVGITDKIKSEFDEIGQIFPSKITSRIKADVKKLSENISSALSIKNTLMHIEFIESSTGIFIVEIGFRIAGGQISELVEKAEGVSLEEALINISLGRDPKIVSKESDALYATKIIYNDSKTENIDTKIDILTSDVNKDEKFESDDFGRGVFKRKGYQILSSQNYEALLNAIGNSK